MAVPDEALIEAIARAIHQEFVYGADPDHYDDEDEGLARAAYAAMVEHLGLTEETRIRCGQPVGEFLGHPMACGACQFIRPGACGKAIESRRLVSPWQDVEP